MEQLRKRERTAKLHRHSKAWVEVEGFQWMAERLTLRLIEVEIELRLDVWQKVRQLAVEE